MTIEERIRREVTAGRLDLNRRFDEKWLTTLARRFGCTASHLRGTLYMLRRWHGVRVRGKR